MRIFELFADIGGTLFVAAEFENRVHVFDGKHREKICSVDCFFMGAGRRGAIHADPAPTLVTAGWSNLSVFDVKPEPTARYQIRNLKGVQSVSLTRDHLLVGSECGPMHIRDVRTGAVVRKHRGVRRAHFDESETLVALCSTRGAHVTKWTVEQPAAGFRIAGPWIFFSVFGDGGVLTSASSKLNGQMSSNRLSFHSLAGIEQWHYDYEGPSFQEAAWDQERHAWTLMRPDFPRGLRFFTMTGGTPVKVGFVRRIWSIAFLAGGKQFAASDGWVRDSRSLDRLWQFAEPDPEEIGFTPRSGRSSDPSGSVNP